jgi:hypothetical protein
MRTADFAVSLNRQNPCEKGVVFIRHRLERTAVDFIFKHNFLLSENFTSDNEKKQTSFHDHREYLNIFWHSGGAILQLD